MLASLTAVVHSPENKCPLVDRRGVSADQSPKGALHALGAAINEMHVYTAGEVLYGVHYAEAVTVDDQLRPVADLTRNGDHSIPCMRVIWRGK
jgi:hypothetical protein